MSQPKTTPEASPGPPERDERDERDARDVVRVRYGERPYVPARARRKFATLLRQLMDRNGIGVRPTSKRCGVSHMTIQRLLAGEARDIQVKTLGRILKNLGATPRETRTAFYLLAGGRLDGSGW